MWLRSLLVPFLSLPFLPVFAAQGQVWVVDDTAATAPDFTNLQSAIDSVADGDILLVKAGTYAGMKIVGKSLTIQAEAGASVNVVDNSATPLATCGQLQTSICALGPSQSVRLRGLSISANGRGLLLDSNAGLVWIEECSITCGDHVLGVWNSCDGTGAGLEARDCADVVLVRSSFTGADGEACHLFNPGCDTCFDYGPEAGAGLLADSSEVHAFACAFSGGRGKGRFGSECEYQSQKGGYGVRGLGTPAPFLFLSDCALQGGNGLGCVLDESCGFQNNDGGDGLFWLGTAAVLDCSFQAGTPSTCGDGGTAGVPIVSHPSSTVRELPGSALRMRATSPVRENGSVDLVFEGPAFAPIWLLASTEPAATYGFYPRGSLLVGGAVVVELLGALDASGTLQHTVSLGPLPPGLDGRVFFLQGLLGSLPTTFPKLSLFPRPRSLLGEASLLLKLDESF